MEGIPVAEGTLYGNDPHFDAACLHHAHIVLGRVGQAVEVEVGFGVLIADLAVVPAVVIGNGDSLDTRIRQHFDVFRLSPEAPGLIGIGRAFFGKDSFQIRDGKIVQGKEVFCVFEKVVRPQLIVDAVEAYGADLLHIIAQSAVPHGGDDERPRFACLRCRLREASVYRDAVL